MTKEILIWVPVIALVVGVISLIRKIIIDKKTLKGKLSLKCYKSTTLSDKLLEVVSALKLNITNIGFGPITIVQCKIRLENGQNRLLKYPNLPVRLLPGEVFESNYSLEFINQNITSVFIVDHHGKKWKLNRKQVNKLHNDLYS